MKTLEQLKKEAAKRGLVEGAKFMSPTHNGYSGTVNPTKDWSVADNETLWNGPPDDILLFSKEYGWATVITPAPSKEEGLKEGDAVECGPAMRAAIVELAKELKLDMTVSAADTSVHKKGMSWVKHGFNEPRLHRWNYQDSFHRPHIPEEFIRKMRITAALPKPEPPIWIGSDVVKFNNGSIQVGCTTIDNATVRSIASKLID